MTLRRVLVANRGEIALRVVRACFDEGIESVLAVSAADRDSLAARLADRTVVVGPAAAAESYLSIERMVAAATTTGCDALHPGYGFLSERPELAEACESEGVAFVGPPSAVLRRSGDKLRAREVARSIGVPTGGGSAALADGVEAIAVAEQLDAYPLILKASAGGGGRGMTIVRSAEGLAAAFEKASREAERAFGDGTLYLERYIERARHVEVQVLADRHGTVLHLGERDCSMQRRHQKLIEEAPAVGLPDGVVTGMHRSAVELARALSYEGAGTVEFLVDAQRGDFCFLEINARVQVEHPVTEMITGVDIVRAQLRIAGGHPLDIAQDNVVVRGHAVEVRVNAEDPDRDFAPHPGRLERWWVPPVTGVRVDSAMEPGSVIPPYYDSMVAKIIAHAPDRLGAVDLLTRVLDRTQAEGVSTTLPLHRALLRHERFREAPVTTRWLEEEYQREAAR
jgi:acetyl-CoA carboxylase biotin carboxylase subunit